MPAKNGLHAFYINLYLYEFFEPILFLTLMESMAWKGNFSQIWKVAKSPKLERPQPPKLVCMHFTSNSTCMNFLSRFYFFDPIDYIVHGPKEIGHFWWKANLTKGAIIISETKDATPTKLGARGRSVPGHGRVFAWASTLVHNEIHNA